VGFGLNYRFLVFNEMSKVNDFKVPYLREKVLAVTSPSSMAATISALLQSFVRGWHGTRMSVPRSIFYL
jgi:hypothetical protein